MNDFTRDETYWSTYWLWTWLTKIAVAINLYVPMGLLIAKWLGWLQLSYTTIILIFVATFILSSIVGRKRARFIMKHEKRLSDE